MGGIGDIFSNQTENNSNVVFASGNNNNIFNYENNLIKEINQKNDFNNYTIEDNFAKKIYIEKKFIEKKTIKGLTILENVKQCLPEDINRDDLKIMIYKALENKIINNQLNYIYKL